MMGGNCRINLVTFDGVKTHFSCRYTRGRGSVHRGLVCAQAVDTGARREHAAAHERVAQERLVPTDHGREGAERA